ncbi:uncharacterized protein K441DRAFT_538359, partial [Cenococcum geophilum 1.58]|uniref:uncharacterized protein n=1 Tax=Cenococcum geophilum 1.58 TaxID=794803 RepID=UPI00358E869C
ININKSKFYTIKTKYLSLIILTNSITIDPKKKVKVIINWQEPKNVKDVRAFIGFANFY